MSLRTFLLVDIGAIIMHVRRRICVSLIAMLLLVCAAGTLAVNAQTGGRRLARVPAPVGTSGATQELYTGSYALLVGISKYDHPEAWSSLDTVPREMSELASALQRSGFDRVEQVTNPTGQELRRAVEDFIGRYGYDRGNRLLFFFSGHGFSLDQGERGYFVPRDAPDPTTNEASFRRTALSMQQVATWAQDLTAKHALFAFDSCFSGTIFRTRDRVVPTRISELTAKPVRQFLSAGGAGEPVPARSVFTPSLIRALRGDADLDKDGFVTGTELGNFVQREVIAYKTRQTPQFGKIRDPQLDEGDFVFAIPRAGDPVVSRDPASANAANPGVTVPAPAAPSVRTPSTAPRRNDDAAAGAKVPAPTPSSSANAETIYNEGVILFNSGKFDEARARFERAITVDPTLAVAHYQLAMTQLNAGRLNEARTSLENYLRIAPGGPMAATARSLLTQIK